MIKETIQFLIKLSCLACLISLPATTNAARILGVFPSPSKSHVLIHCSIAETLAAAGHDVTVLSTIPNMFPKAKYNYIQFDGALFSNNFAKDMVNKPASVYKKLTSIVQNAMSMGNTTLNHPKMLKFLASHGPGDFDAVILGYYFNDFYLGIGAHFQCPIIISWMIQPFFATNAMIGNPEEIAYAPAIFTGIKQPMDFMARLQNFLAAGYEQWVMNNIMQRSNKELYSFNFPPDRYPSLEEVYKNVSLIFANHHFSQGPIRANVPALIETGGIQIKEQPNPLPTDIQQIIDSAENGVIYFCLGTIFQGSHLSKEKVTMIFNVLSKLPYTVLVKWDTMDAPRQSANIFYKTWLPQDDILANPKVKLFITHGGLGSVVESQYHGVPMVGIPFYGDQHSNMATVEKSGFGLTLEYATMTEEGFRNAVLEVLHSQKYTKNVQEFSKLYRDRPMTPRQLVRYWVDYVIRHNGAKHMQSPAVYMNWWQLRSLDVIGFLLAVISLMLAGIVIVCKFIWCKVKAARKPVQKATKTKKNK